MSYRLIIIFVQVVMTSKELCALKNSALHTHPIKVATASKMMSKLKRSFGEEVWQRISNVITLAQTNKAPTLWFSTMTELIQEQEQKEKEEELTIKLAALVEHEKKERILREQKQQDNNLFRVQSSISKTPVVIRRRAANVLGEDGSKRDVQKRYSIDNSRS